MKKEEREKLVEEVLNKRSSYTNLYQDSLKAIESSEKELNKLIAENQKNLADLSKTSHNYNDEYLASLQKQMESDFNTKIETPKTVVVGKASKELFEQIEKELKEKIIGQDEACQNLCVAFRRPYVVGSNPLKIRNSIILSGNKGSGRHELIKQMAYLLKKHGLSLSDEVVSLDMKRYQSSSQELLFLQDLYVALNAKSPIIIIEGFKESSPIFNRMLAELVNEGTCLLNQRYSLVNNQLQEATAKLSKDVIDHLSGNDKTLVFISDDKPSKLIDVFGKTFVDNIADRIETTKLSKEAIKIIIENLLKELNVKVKTQLEVELKVEQSVNDFLLSKYEPEMGVYSISPLVAKIYDQLVDLSLKNGDLNTLTLSYEKQLEVSFKEKKQLVEVINDESEERQAIQKELDEIVGLNSVKEYLYSLEDHLKLIQIRKQQGLKVSEVSKHMIFTGNPGTGKTTIARIVSRMMKACGVLKQGQLVEVTRADLVGQYVGHTAPLTMKVINSALGGVLFIDEAYSLYQGKDDSFGREAIDTLVKAMEDHRDDLIVILAGYSKEMEDFLSANSGLKSRFANIIHFPDYSGKEMLQIAKAIVKSKDYYLGEDCEKPLKDYFTKVQAKNDPNSGNGRLVRNKIEEAILKQSKRLLANPKADIRELKLEDFDLS